MQLKKISLIAPSLYQEKISQLFAKQSAINQQEFYAFKGEGSLSKLEMWAYNGKMAEYAVFNTLLSFPQYKYVIPPDVIIYTRDRKSHDADIKTEEKNIHVKSCMVVGDRLSSWLFSTEDKLVKTPKDNDIVALVSITLPNKFDAYFVEASKLVGNYKKPFSEKTVAHAIYEEDLITSSSSS